MSDINLKAEVVRVREEVQYFRAEGLPRFLSRAERTDEMIEWQSAVDRLADGLTDKYPGTLRSEDYAQFLF